MSKAKQRAQDVVRVRRSAYKFAVSQASDFYYGSSTLHNVVRAFGASALGVKGNAEVQQATTLARVYIEQYKANCRSRSLQLLANAL